MKRTSGALKRFGVPVLAATTVLAGAQVALGTSAFAAVANGTLTISPNPGSGSATPAFGVNGDIQQSVTYTPGTQSVNTGSQTITITVSGNATIVNPTPNTQPPSNAAPAAQNGLVIAGNGKTATCTTTTAPPAPPTNVVQGCNFAVHDVVSESVTVTASDSTDQTTPQATATDNFAALNFSGCATIPNVPANCVTQQAAGTTATYSVTYLEGGSPAAGKEVDFTICDNGSGGNTCGTAAPAGTTTNQANFPTQQSNANTVATSPSFARCTTNAQGQCSVTVQANGNAATNSSIITATTVNTAPYPASQAQEQVNYVASVTPGRFTQGGATWIKPTPNTIPPDGLPGEVLQRTYTLSACQANSTSGQNVCLAGQTLAGQSVSLTVDHGFFTPNCTKNLVTNYANCTFNTTPAAGTPVGDLKSLGQTITATTDANGQVTVSTSIARDAAFDQAGTVVSQITAVAGGVTLVESVNGQSASGTTCNAPGTPAPNAPQAGCPTGSVWSTDNAPLNGGTVSIVSVPNPNSSTEPALDSTKTNNVPNNQSRVFVVHLTDQFGNLTSGGNASGVTLTKTGAGSLYVCSPQAGAPPQPSYSGANSCLNPTQGGTSSTDASGVTTTTYTNVKGSYLSAFTSNQSRFMASPTPFNGGAPATGTETITASWAAPTTTFNTFAAGPPAVATYSQSTATKTATVTINWFTQTAQAVLTFSTTPSNKVPAGTVVTVSATVKDQFGNPINGANVAFQRSGPTTGNGTSCTASNQGVQTNAQGQAGFSFTCQNPSNQTVTIIVTDNSGNELARGTQPITFTGSTPARTTIFAHFVFCKSPSKGDIRCKVQVNPHISGLQVTLRDARGHFLGSQRTNHKGLVVINHTNLKSGSKVKVHARVAGTGKTKPTTTGVATVRIK